MGKFKHHSSFPKEKAVQAYRFPHVCFECRKSFKKPVSEAARLCPDCGSDMIMLGRNFSAPKARDKEQWKKVMFLVEHGFLFQKIYDRLEKGVHIRVGYPDTLQEARDFVVAYEDQAIKSL